MNEYCSVGVSGQGFGAPLLRRVADEADLDDNRDRSTRRAWTTARCSAFFSATGKMRFRIAAEIVAGAPAMAADVRAPLPDVAHAVLAEIENDVARQAFRECRPSIGRDADSFPGSARPCPHRANVRRLRVLAFGDVRVGAPVVFQEIKPPIGELPRVLLLVLVAARESRRKSSGPGERVDAGLESLGVDVVGERRAYRESACSA